MPLRDKPWVLLLHSLNSRLLSILSHATSCSQVHALREERRKWRELQAAKSSLEDEVSLWRGRFQTEAARADELAADVARLSAGLMAAEADAAAHRQRADSQPRGVRCEMFMDGSASLPAMLQGRIS